METLFASTYTPSRAMQAATVQWLKVTPWDIAATFTFKEGTSVALARQIHKNYWDRIDWEVRKLNPKKKHLKMKRVCFTETGSSKTNFHYHIAALKPVHLSIDTPEFCQTLSSIWKSNPHAGFVCRVEPIASQGAWTNYICKTTKFSMDALDLTCTRF